MEEGLALWKSTQLCDFKSVFFELVCLGENFESYVCFHFSFLSPPPPQKAGAEHSRELPFCVMVTMRELCLLTESSAQ